MSLDKSSPTCFWILLFLFLNAEYQRCNFFAKNCIIWVRSFFLKHQLTYYYLLISSIKAFYVIYLLLLFNNLLFSRLSSHMNSLVRWVTYVFIFWHLDFMYRYINCAVKTTKNINLWYGRGILQERSW